MTESIFIVWTRHGVDRMLKKKPASSSPGEYIVQLDVTIPGEVFAKQPIPVVEVQLEKRQIGGWPAIVDPQQSTFAPDVMTEQQLVVQRQLAAIYQAARSSVDPNMVKEARMTLNVLIDAGVDVRIVSEDAEPTEEDPQPG